MPRRSYTTTSSTTPTRARRPVGAPALRVAPCRVGMGGQRARRSAGPPRSCSATCCSGGATNSSTRGWRALPDRDAARAARAEFMRMRTEVTAGQYLDILEERAWHTAPDSEQRLRAERVIVYKSAKYSVEAPLAIGGADRRSDERATRRAPRRSGCPSASPTSSATTCSASTATPRSPASRAATTCARASARCSSPSHASGWRPGSAACSTSSSAIPSSEAEQVRMLQRTISECGAVDEIERIIADRTSRRAAAALPTPR